MALTRTLLSLTALSAVMLGCASSGSDSEAEARKAAADAGMPLPEPTPEQAVLQKLVGNWDAKITAMPPGAPPEESKGSAVYKSVGGLWVASDFNGKFGEIPFTGHGIDGYDTYKKKFVSTWVDSFSSEVLILEGTHDAATKTTTMSGDMHDMATGKIVRVRLVTETKDDDHFIFHMFGPGPDGKEIETLKIEYERG